jgi:hypothetical protein
MRHADIVDGKWVDRFGGLTRLNRGGEVYEQQIPFGDDNKNGKGKSNNYNKDDRCG